MGNGGKIWGDSYTHTVQTIISRYRSCSLFSIQVLPDFFQLVFLPTSSSEKTRRNSERLSLTFVEWTETNPTLFFPMFSDWRYHLFCPGEPFSVLHYHYIKTDQQLISLCSIHAISSRRVIRIKKLMGGFRIFLNCFS